MRGFVGLVLEKGAELAPARRPVDQRDLPRDDAAEAHPHRQCHDVQPVKEVCQLHARYGVSHGTLASSTLIAAYGVSRSMTSRVSRDAPPIFGHRRYESMAGRATVRRGWPRGDGRRRKEKGTLW